MSDVITASIALAQERVRKGLKSVARQRALIDRLRSIGRPSSLESSLLRNFESTLAIFEDDLRRFEKEATDSAKVRLLSVGALPRR